MDHHDAPPPVDDGGAALAGRGLLLHQAGPPQVDDEPRDEPAPKPAWGVCHPVSPADAVGRLVDNLLSILRWWLSPSRVAHFTAEHVLVLPIRRRLRRLGGRVGEVDGRSLQGQHGRNQPLAVAEGEGDLKPLQQLEVLGEELAREAPAVTEDERHVGLLQNPVVDKVLSLWHGDHLRQQVSQPDRVDEVEVVEAAQVVIVVEEDSVVMEELGS